MAAIFLSYAREDLSSLRLPRVADEDFG